MNYGNDAAESGSKLGHSSGSPGYGWLWSTLASIVIEEVESG